MPYMIDDDNFPICEQKMESCLTVITDKQERIRLDAWNIAT